MPQDFLPLTRMLERAELALEDSDAAYFLELLYTGEMIVKFLVVELLATMQDDRDRHAYALEHKLVRANGIGDWAEVLDELLTGPSSQHLVPDVRDSHRAINENHRPSETTWQRRAIDLLNTVCRGVDSSYEDTSRQKASLRQWVRSFVWLRNRTRGHGAPKLTTLADVCPDLRDSIELLIKNAPCFSHSWAVIRRSLSGKYRVSCFAGDRIPFSYLAKETEHSLPDGAYVFLGQPRRARLLFSDPDLTDFMLPNGAFSGDTFEVISYITDERRRESGSDYMLHPQSRPLSETTAIPLDIIGNAFSNMPPQRDGYVQRLALESDLHRLLTDDRHPVVTLQGRGGVGKTSLALEVLHRVAHGNVFTAIVWFSARDIDLLPEGPRVVRADVLSIEDVARDFFTLMKRDRLTTQKEAQAYLTDCLSGQENDSPYIFVFDNFETIRQPAELYSYLSNAVRLPNKVLITTRARDFKADYPINVHGMTRDEFATLVDEVSGRLKISHLITSDYEDELFEESDGHPYIAKILLGEVAHAGTRLAPKRIVAAKDALLDALFDRSFAALSPAAQRVFLTLCSWRSLVPRIGIEAVLLRPGNERLLVEKALSELQQASLVEVLPGENPPEDFLSVPLAAALFGKKRLVTSPMKIAIDADLELVRGFGATTTTDLARGLGPRVDRLARAIASRARTDADLGQELAVIEYIASEYPPAWLKLADLYDELGQGLPAAIRAVSRYLEESPDDSEAWKRLILLYRRAGDALGEMNARIQYAELADPPFSELSSAANRLNGLLSRREIEIDLDQRRQLVRRLRRLIEPRVNEATATDLSALAWLCMHDQDREAARKWAEEGLKVDPQDRHCQHFLEGLARERNGD